MPGARMHLNFDLSLRSEGRSDRLDLFRRSERVSPPEFQTQGHRDLRCAREQRSETCSVPDRGGVGEALSGDLEREAASVADPEHDDSPVAEGLTAPPIDDRAQVGAHIFIAVFSATSERCFHLSPHGERPRELTPEGIDRGDERARAREALGVRDNICADAEDRR